MQDVFHFRNLTNEIRQYMKAEVEMDIADDVLVSSVNFNNQGHSIYPIKLVEAVLQHDEQWLSEQLKSCFVSIDKHGVVGA